MKNPILVLTFLAPLPAFAVLYSNGDLISEGLTSFAPQMLMIYPILAGLAYIWGKKWLAISTLLSSLILAFFLFNFLFPSQVHSEGASHLRVAHFNVLVSNKGKDSLIKKALNSDADLISFQEVSPAWEKALHKALQAKYPWSWCQSSQDPFGLAVYSRFPLEDVQREDFGYSTSVSGKMCHPQGQIHFLSTHPPSPVTPRRLQERNRQIYLVADKIKAIRQPSLVIGDFNAVPWSRTMQSFCSISGLQDSRNSLTTTWPSWMPIMGVPIDYIFHSNSIACHGFSTIKTSSDHLGIVGEYSLRP